jgi:hypothetical protein
MDISGLDAASSEALRDVVEVFSRGQVNGSVLDLTLSISRITTKNQ